MISMYDMTLTMQRPTPRSGEAQGIVPRERCTGIMGNDSVDRAMLRPTAAGGECEPSIHRV